MKSDCYTLVSEGIPEEEGPRCAKGKDQHEMKSSSSKEAVGSCEKENSTVRNNFTGSLEASGLDKKLKESGTVTVQIMRQSVSPLTQFTPQRMDNVVGGRNRPLSGSRTIKSDDHSMSSTNKSNKSKPEYDGVSMNRLNCFVPGCHVSREANGALDVGKITTIEAKQVGEDLGMPMASSPCDSDSFDWRKQLSPLVVRPRSKRRSSFGPLLRPAEGTPDSIGSPERMQSAAPRRAKAREGPEGLKLASPEATSLTSALLASASSPALRHNLKREFDLGSSPAILDPILEDAELSNQSDGNEVETTYQTLLRENNELKKCLKSQKSYDTQIAPIRNLFETLPKLKKENEALKQENAKLTVSLSETESKVAESISDLQSQMMTALRTAVEKARRLQQELDASQTQNRALRKMLATKQSSEEEP